MAELLEQTKVGKGYHLHIIPTKKFKTITMMFRFLAPLQRDTATIRALLPFVLQKGTKKLPTERSFRTKLDELYGANFTINCSKKGENHLISMQVSFVNEKFLPTNENVTEEIIDLMHQILFEPNSEQNGFRKDVVTREKEALKQKIESIKDQKMSYANMRLIDEMCKGEPYETHVHGYIEDLEQIDEEILFHGFQQMIQQDRLDIYVVGDVEQEKLVKLMEDKFSFEQKESTEPMNSHTSVERKEFKEVIERQKVQQGKLHLGFRTNTTFRDEDYYVLQVFNGLFGGFPHSKLFMNVREKHQLAYYASSRMESQKGLLLVFSGIAPLEYEKAKNVILEQWEEMKKGNITDEEMEKTKSLTINQLKETLDHPVGIAELMYHQVLASKQVQPSDMFEAIKQVTKEDLVQMAHKIQLDTIYFLTSEGDEA